MKVLLDCVERVLIYGALIGLALLGGAFAQAELADRASQAPAVAAAPIETTMATAADDGGAEVADAVAAENDQDGGDEGNIVSPTPTAANRPQSAPDGDAITRLQIARITLDAEVVPAPFTGATWEIPAFKVGHAEYSAGAGEPGNAILFGHVTSVLVGHVFQNLDQLRPGDPLFVSSARHEFRYHVVERRVVPRTDTSILENTPTASLSLITCTGTWLPLEHDYTDRLLVRAELG